MKKIYSFAFLLAAFCVIAFIYSDSVRYYAKLNTATASKTRTNPLYNTVHNKQSDVLFIPESTVSPAISLYKVFQKSIINGTADAYGALHFFALLKSSVRINQLLSSKKYFCYIYPSHNFW